MVPIKLSLEGLYSYQQRQEIDFTRLIEAGIFGVFGKVGSGKSSILEAISFGLYGESERLNARDNRAYNMMNLKSDVAIIDFEFYNFEDKKYRIRREFRRNSKRFEDVKRVDAILYEWQGEEWIPLPDLNIDEIVGLSYENFKRTIIIPQGQFKEFIELGGAARTKMMQQIFNLDRFDLASKVKALHVKAKEQFDQLLGRLQGLTEVTPELIKQCEELLKIESEYLRVENELFKSEAIILQQMNLVKEDFNELSLRKKELTSFEEQTLKMEELRASLVQYEQLDKVFSPYLKELGSIHQKKESSENQLKVLQGVEVEMGNRFRVITEELSFVELQYADLDKLKQECNELKLIKEVNELLLEKEVQSNRFVNGVKFLNQCEQEFTALEELKKEKQQKILSEKAKRIDTQVLLLVGEWFQKSASLLLSSEENKENLAAIGKEKEEVDAKINDLKFKDITHWEAEIENYRSSFIKEQTKLEDELAHIRVREQLIGYAEELEAGGMCPLCGSLEHPDILQGEDFLEKKNVLLVAIEKTKDKMLRLNTYQNTAYVLFERKAFLEKQYEELLEKSAQNTLQQEAHQKLFAWKHLHISTPEQFMQWKKEATDHFIFVDKLEKEYDGLVDKVERDRGKLQDARKELNVIELNIAKLDSSVQSLANQVTRLNIEAYLKLKEELVLQELEEKIKHIGWVEERYILLTKEKQEIQPNLIKTQSEVLSLSNTIVEIGKDIEAIEAVVNEQLLLKNMTSLNEVHKVLDQKLDVEAIRNQLNDFEVRVAVIKSQIAQLELKLNGLSFNEEERLVQQHKVEQLQQRVLLLTENSAKLKGEYERLQKELLLKQKIQEQYNQLDLRLKNINILENMFKGSGFVNYVSSIYLKNLIDIANHRFHRLTNNQLSLQLNEQNDFEVIDYLNEGKCRSVKTLSGGQTFQVALSLALALAESVQTLSKSKRNFFFIDEGFGTQDSESVNIVFDTLSNLRKENRIVGIISHVDELQERIPMSLTVTKDDEKGSVIEEYQL